MDYRYEPGDPKDQVDRPYAEVRRGTDPNAQNDVLMINDDEALGGYVDDEVNANDPRAAVPSDPRQRTGQPAPRR